MLSAAASVGLLAVASMSDRRASGERFTLKAALVIAVGGFLMGFDASVISGVVGFIEPEFSLTKIQLGWSVASLTLTATLAMMVAGPLSDRIGRRPVLLIAAKSRTAGRVLDSLLSRFIPASLHTVADLQGAVLVT